MKLPLIHAAALVLFCQIGLAQNFEGEQVLSSSADGAWGVYSADIDGDGDMDAISASYRDHKVAWYENDGAGNFGTEQVISTTAYGARRVYSTDIDGDGDMDVLSASGWDDTIAWYENDGAGNFGTEQAVTTSADKAWDVYSADIDGDGDMDVLSASRDDNKVAWYENDGAGNFGSEQVISTTAYGACAVYSVDIDGDGDMDVLSASQDDNKIAWYENNGAGNFGTEQVISSNAVLAAYVYSEDLDGDGDMDALSASQGDDKIAWYENDGAGNFGTERIISTTADYVGTAYSADLDGDGDMDVLSTTGLGDEVAWYENDGAGNFGDALIIASDVEGAGSAYSADLDGDGDMDVLASSGHQDKIAWYENFSRQKFKLLASDGTVGDTFGASVAMSNNTAIIGAYYDENHGPATGAAYLFDTNNGTELFKLTASDGAFHDHFGISVDISGNTAIVGSYADDDNGLDSGAAYLFDIITGIQTAKLLPSDGDSGDNFGISVAISGNTAIVGAYRDEDNGSDSGSAYLFDITTANQLWKLLPDDGDGGDHFGLSVAIDGNTAIVGAQGDSDNGYASGSAYLFDITTGSQIAKLLPNDGALHEHFGCSVAIDSNSNRAIIGAYADDINGHESGSAYIFDTTTANQIVKLLPSDGAADDFFGLQVGINNNTVIVGARFDDDGGLNTGSAYIFNTDTGAELAKLRPFDRASDDNFAWASAISKVTSGPSVNWTAIIGARFDDDNGVDSGSAYLLDISDLIDCNDNGVDDYTDVTTSSSLDCNGDYIPDECQLGANDCNSNSIPDDCDAALGLDCNSNGYPDSCDIAWEWVTDCDGNGTPDSCESFTDCNANGVPDDCDVSSGSSSDCDSNGNPDECDLDCNANGFPDSCEIATNPSVDLNFNGIIDSCECLANSYCIASPNTVSATGAPISLDGLPSLSVNNMALRADSLRPNQFGVFFYGPVKQDPPVSFGDGYRCVGTFDLKRLNPPVATGTGTAQRALDMTAVPLNNIQAGDTRYFQFWYRDPGVIGAGYNLTDGLEITFCP